ncbi:MAG: hypothetical protein QGH25_22755 [Candidatus Latescibacteria bacterium]|nr:hypothetical protein [Candidatus Latescibacterota bacterium]
MSYKALCYILLLAFSGCGEKETNERFADPASTFRTYKQALEQGDYDLLWECYSLSQKGDEERQVWLERWRQKPSAEIKARLRREIAQEQIINERIGYLLFDASTLSDERASPFYYFIRETDGWKITSHLDSTFHHELEQAIERGEYKLPDF